MIVYKSIIPSYNECFDKMNVLMFPIRLTSNLHFLPPSAFYTNAVVPKPADPNH